MLQKLFVDDSPPINQLAKNNNILEKAKPLSTRQLNTKRRADEKKEKQEKKLAKKQARKNLSDTDSLGSKAATKNQKKDIEERIKAIAKQTKAPKCSIRVATKGTDAYEYIKQQNITAYFDPNTIPPEIWHKEGASNYVLNHEYYHYEEYCKIGKEEFIKGDFGTPIESATNTVLREKYVAEKMWENAEKYSFNEAEKIYTKSYFFKIFAENMNKGIELKNELIPNFKK